MNQLAAEHERKYRALRTASNGASLSLVTAFNRYIAYGECALRIAKVLDTRGLTDAEGIPQYSIPVEEMNEALGKLVNTYSIALLDIQSTSQDTRFVLVWKIPQRVLSASWKEFSDSFEPPADPLAEAKAITLEDLL